MAFIKEGASAKIFVLVVLVLVAMVSLLVVFQNNFRNINSRYNQKVEELNATFDNLTNAQSRLNQTAQELEIRSSREEDLKGKYGDLKDERDSLETERNNLQNDVDVKEKRIKALEVDIAIKEEALSKEKSQVADLSEKVNCYQNGCPQTNC